MRATLNNFYISSFHDFYGRFSPCFVKKQEVALFTELQMKSSRSTSKSSRHFNSYRPLGIIRSLKIELSVLIILDTFLLLFLRGACLS